MTVADLKRLAAEMRLLSNSREGLDRLLAAIDALPDWEPKLGTKDFQARDVIWALETDLIDARAAIAHAVAAMELAREALKETAGTHGEPCNSPSCTTKQRVALAALARWRP